MSVTSSFASGYSDPETGYIYLRARYYDPSTAKFLSRDPAVAITQSAYAYAGDNPLNGIDPLGLKPWWKTAISIAGTVAGVAAVGLAVAAVVVTAPISVPLIGTVSAAGFGVAALVAGGVSVGLGGVQAGMDCNQSVDARSFIEGATTAAGLISLGLGGVGARLIAQGAIDASLAAFGQAANMYSAAAGAFGAGLGIAGMFADGSGGTYLSSAGCFGNGITSNPIR